MNDGDRRVPRITEVEAARVLLEKMGLTPADLLRVPSPSLAAPTFAEYVPRVSDAVSSGTRRVYGSYWNRVLGVWAPPPITDISALDISQLAEQVKATVVKRRNARGGRGAAEHLIAALRCMYKYAVADGIMPRARIQQHRWPSRAGCAVPVGRCRRIALRSSVRWLLLPGMTRPWTRCCCGYISRPRAGAGARWR